MHVVGQDDPGIDVEWHECFDAGHAAAQWGDVGDEQIALAVAQIDREEKGGSGDAMAAVFGHRVSLRAIIGVGQRWWGCGWMAGGVFVWRMVAGIGQRQSVWAARGMPQMPVGAVGAAGN